MTETGPPSVAAPVVGSRVLLPAGRRRPSPCPRNFSRTGTLRRQGAQRSGAHRSGARVGMLRGTSRGNDDHLVSTGADRPAAAVRGAGGDHRSVVPVDPAVCRNAGEWRRDLKAPARRRTRLGDHCASRHPRGPARSDLVRVPAVVRSGERSGPAVHVHEPDRWSRGVERLESQHSQPGERGQLPACPLLYRAGGTKRGGEHETHAPEFMAGD
jgi:hypothetical protein